MRVARTWKFPDTIVEAMRPLPRGRIPAAADDVERIRYLAGLASALAEIHATEPLDRILPACEQLAERTADLLPLTQDDIDQLVRGGLILTEKYATLMERTTDEAIFLKQLRRWQRREAGQTPALESTG